MILRRLWSDTPLLPAPPISTRLAAMAIGWGAVGVIYGISGLRGPESAFHLTPSAIDLWFRFDPTAIWAYLSFFLLVPLGYLASTPERLVWLMRAMVLCALGAGLVFAIFPTTMSFPPTPTTGVSAGMLAALIRVDTLVNCLPSLHVALSLICAAALWDAKKPWRMVALIVWLAVICLSILQLQRHQFVDLLAGAALALWAGLVLRALGVPLRLFAPVARGR